ncbi:Transcription factor like [Quillaja saponaria]|uniref:Transcription factor like n=1 Tax=Quillaja saponaria TaxID=32244 RepID=A0AAD7KQ49_QUISA|nr:Transcription factor like [Quillaja saponaria]
MEEHLNPLAVTHLLQHTLRSLCIHENSQWVYAVFWRILPRNYPPPKWEGHGANCDRSRGNRRNWILVWEDGFCNFSASSAAEINTGDCPSSSVYGLQPELFFKMSHEIYNYGEGLIGKIAADHSHKWIYKEAKEQEINFLSAWHNSTHSHPRTWEAQFQSGIKTIALIAVREGVVQLGSIHKVIEDLSYVVQLIKKFSYIERIPGVLLPHPSSNYACPFIEGYGAQEAWHFQGTLVPPTKIYDQFNQSLRITPSMSSLEALLSKLPTVVPPVHSQPQSQFVLSQSPLEFMGMQKVAQEEIDEEVYSPEMEYHKKIRTLEGMAQRESTMVSLTMMSK